MDKGKIFLWAITIGGVLVMLFMPMHPMRFVGMIAVVSACALGTEDGYKMAIEQIQKKYVLVEKEVKT